MSSAAFVQGLMEQPEDDALRLVYADWLEENGDIRGDFLRVAVGLRLVTPDSPALPALRRRVQELRPSVPAEWLVRAFRAVAEDDVREVVFRQLMGKPSIFDTFLRVGDGDPSWYLLDRLAPDFRNDQFATGLQPISQAVRHERWSGVFVKGSGLRARLFAIESLKWIDERQCEVLGSDLCDGLAASGNSYLVVLQGGSWAISRVTNLWIS
jgi:uncharacterized protein (TIGR02996 family)